MIEHITPERIANSIMQDTYNGLYVLVEGNKDYKLFSKFLNLDALRIKQTFGCINLFKVFEILNNRGFKLKIGIVDRDFSEILNLPSPFSNVFVTDHHDIEVMIFISSAFDAVLNIYTLPEKVEQFERKVGRPIREIIFDLSDKIGYLKLANKLNNLGLVFKPKTVDGNQIKYHEFIDDHLKFKGDERLIRTVINYSRNKSNQALNYESIKHNYDIVKEVKYPSTTLSNGHDLSNIIFILLKKTLKSSNKMLQDFNSVEDSMILAYEFEEFKKTQLYLDIYDWCKAIGIQVFK